MKPKLKLIINPGSMVDAINQVYDRVVSITEFAPWHVILDGVYRETMPSVSMHVINFLRSKIYD